MQEAQGEDAGYGQDGAEGGVLCHEDADHDEGEVGQYHGAGEPEIAGGGVGLAFAVCPEHAPGQHQPAAEEPAQGGGRHIPEQGRISTPMPVLRESPEGYTETTC